MRVNVGNERSADKGNCAICRMIDVKMVLAKEEIINVSKAGLL